MRSQPKLAVSSTIVLFLAAICSWAPNAHAANILLSSRPGSSAHAKLVNAYNLAQSGDVIIVDRDVNFDAKSPITIKKVNIKFQGKSRKSGKFRLYRTKGTNAVLKVQASQTKLVNLLFSGGAKPVQVGAGEGVVLKRLKFVNCDIPGGTFTGLDFRNSNFDGVVINKCKFSSAPFSLLVSDCRTVKNFRVLNSTFNGSDHQISFDAAELDGNLQHSGIEIRDCVFNLTKRFNIALANTRNVKILDCNLKGGTNSYSQCVHIEDRSRNILIKNSTLVNTKHAALLIYSTDRFGHGTGPALTLDQKRNYGSGNVTLDGNTLESGKAESAIRATYGTGFLNIFGNNKIISGNRGLNSTQSGKFNVTINENTLIKGKKWSEIQKLKDRNAFVQIVK